MTDLNKIIGNNICEYRKKLNLTQLELGGIGIRGRTVGLDFFCHK